MGSESPNLGVPGYECQRFAQRISDIRQHVDGLYLQQRLYLDRETSYVDVCSVSLDSLLKRTPKLDTEENNPK